MSVGSTTVPANRGQRNGVNDGLNERRASDGLSKPKPPIKWAGGKQQLLPQFAPLFPTGPVTKYAEPFVGGGAVFFYLEPESAVLIDNNPELMNFYEVVRTDVEGLIEHAKGHLNDRDYYYSIRELDPERLSPVERASRFLYLNKTAYNGLWRVNSKGKHNVPFGRYRNPKIVDEWNLRLVSAALRNVLLIRGDFERIVEFAERGMFVYFDPPYQPVSDTANFTGYTAEAFGSADQERLARVFRTLDEMGCLLMASNSDTEFIRRLYEGYDIRIVVARRAINCRGEKRGPIRELVIRNYG
ncbi:MAG: DNA adenine methylase [Anaerolineae bacterium]